MTGQSIEGEDKRKRKVGSKLKKVKIKRSQEEKLLKVKIRT